MKLISLYIDNFGKISNYKYDFNDSLNCIYKENGWGKTTLTMFIKAMLYGLSSTSSSDLEKNDRKKYLPWSGLNCGGYLIIEVDNKIYKIERTFGKKAKDDTCIIYDMSTNKPTEIYDENIGQQILNLNAFSFERSVFIPQKELSADFGSDISSKLSSLIGGTNDNHSYDNAIETIQKHMKDLKRTGNKGLIYETKDKLKEVEESIDVCNTKINNIPVVLKEIEQIQQQIDNKTIEKNNIKEKIQYYNKTLEKINKLDTLKKYEEDINLSNQKIKSYNEILNNKNISNKDIFEIKNKYQQYLNEKEKIKDVDLPLDDSLKIFNDNNVLSENKLEQISSKVDAYYDTQEVKKPSILRTIIIPAFFTLVMIVSLIMLFVNEDFKKSGIGLILISISLIFIVLSSTYKNKSKNVKDENLEKELREFFAKYNMFESSFKENLIELKHLNKKYIEYNLVYKQVVESNNSSKDMSNLLLKEIEQFLSDFNLISNDNVSKINELEKTFILYENEIENNKRLHFVKEDFIKNNDLSDINDDLSNYNIEKLNEMLDIVDKEIIDLNNTKNTNVNLKNELEKQIDILEEHNLLKDSLTQQYKEMSYKYEVYSNTIKMLSTAQENLMAKYVKPMKDNVSKYFDIILKDKPDFSLTIDFDLKFIENGINKEISYYSKGYQQIVMLCMRFALIDCLYVNEKPFVVLDDPLVNFDDNKIQLVIKLLKDISKNIQIVYFTCHESRII